jgi:hypothetical protein
MVRIPYVNKFETQTNLPCTFNLFRPLQYPPQPPLTLHPSLGLPHHALLQR